MKKIVFIFLVLTNTNYSIFAQSSSEIVSELERMFINYNITGTVSQSTKLKKADVRFSAPNVSFHTVVEEISTGTRYVTEKLIMFDVTKASYEKEQYGRKGLVINCSSGIDVEGVMTTYPSFGKVTSNSGKNLNSTYVIYISSDVIINRLINALNNLKALSKESNAKNVPHIFDDAELTVQKISFVAPDNTGKLNANQTGCIKIEVKNTNSNNALNVACVVKETNKSDLFSYEQYTSVDKISGFETEIINIPIKASENVDNNTYSFEVMVTYNGKTIKMQSLNITASNPKKQQSVSSAHGGARNKTIRMRKMAGNTYLISCKVNGLPLDFIFDTGASSVTLSKKQAVFMLKNGYLSKSDIIGSSAYQTASGDIAIGTVIKLKKIEINGLVINNVEASIINSDSAPLLLGQSALSRLGMIQIDYKNSTLTIIR